MSSSLEENICVFVTVMEGAKLLIDCTDFDIDAKTTFKSLLQRTFRLTTNS